MDFISQFIKCLKRSQKNATCDYNSSVWKEFLAPAKRPIDNRPNNSNQLKVNNFGPNQLGNNRIPNAAPNQPNFRPPNNGANVASQINNFNPNLPPRTPVGATPNPAPAQTAKNIVIPNIKLPSNVNLEETLKLAEKCQACALATNRTKVVFGAGNNNVPLMFIGDVPELHDNHTGSPFSGPAGELLNKMIQAMNFSLDEVYLTNIIKCRPPENRLPKNEEISACLSYLNKEIETVKPQVIILLGAVATKALLPNMGNIVQMRGKWYNYNGIPAIPTFHPNYLLKHPSDKANAWKDLQNVMAKLGRSPVKK
jgi:DNA polymerase